MKDIIMKLLFVGLALAFFVIMLINGLATDTRTMDTKKDAEVTKITFPTS